MKRMILMLATLITLPAIAASASSWEGCEKKVMKSLIAKGIQEYGSETAYTGVGGTGAYEDIVKICGYKPMTKKNCDYIYIKIYLGCRHGEAISSDWSYVQVYDPKIIDSNQLEALCEVKDRLTRKEFGNMVCGER